MTITSETIKNLALESGFSMCGIASAGPVQDKVAKAMREYLGRGYHGEMGYLGRNLDKRLEAGRLIEGGCCVICVGLNYYHDRELAGEWAVARYGRFRDYHVVIKERLKRLADRIRAEESRPVQMRCYVDSAPILEKYYAWQAGLGWIGKHSLLLNERYGSWILLGEIVADLELEVDQAGLDRCGDCQACMLACPTGALVGERELDARKCISYWTTEALRDCPEEYRIWMQKRGYGCDICQEACPYCREGEVTGDDELRPREEWQEFNRVELVNMVPEKAVERYKNSTMERTVRNIGRNSGRGGWGTLITGKEI